MLLIQVTAIIGIAWLLRRPARSIGLPIVIGEMLAGFLLGPTFFGTFAPQAFRLAFPVESIKQISELATLIVTSYCFVIGLEFDASHIQGRRASLVLSALTSAIFPAVAGYIAGSIIAANATTSFPSTFKLAVAMCFSVTAFPVLLRIVEDAGMSAHATGIFSIGISAVLELVVWASLPIILAFGTAGNVDQVLPALAWVACFLVIWFTIVRRSLGWLWSRIPSDGFISLLLLIIVGITSAYLTEHIGMHANFGAFVGGFVVPREVSFKLAKKIKPICVFLLPVFFAAAGLKTMLNLGGIKEMVILLALAFLAYGVKAFGTAISVKIAGGFDWKEAATVGTLMCAKGAIGFAVIEICLSSGLLDPHGYSMLAFVVLANTVMSAWGIAFLQPLAGSWFGHSCTTGI
jgi:Kef-type K+ transport system membrane component KefB